MKKGMIKATGPFERVVHWCLALSCILLCITGMGMMYHTLNFFSLLFGGMANMKLVHNFGGLFFAVSLFLAIIMWWKEAGLFSFPEDGQWIAAAGGYLWHVDKMPEVGKYNPGQKMFFLAVTLFGIAMVVSGSAMEGQSRYRLEFRILMRDEASARLYRPVVRFLWVGAATRLLGEGNPAATLVPVLEGDEYVVRGIELSGRELKDLLLSNLSALK